MSKILVLYYSMYGHIEVMSNAVAEGVRSAGAEAVIKRVPEIIPEAKAKEAGVKLDQNAPIATPDELADYDGILFGAPTRIGNIAAQMRKIHDQTGKLWLTGAQLGKPGGVFTSSATLHGGLESTLTSFLCNLLQLGMLFVGLPYSAQVQMRLDEIT